MSYFNCRCGAQLPLKLSNEKHLFGLLPAAVLNYGLSSIEDEKLAERFELLRALLPQPESFPQRIAFEDLAREVLKDAKRDVIVCPACNRLWLQDESMKNKFDCYALEPP
jgi:hypothetical protein